MLPCLCLFTEVTLTRRGHNTFQKSYAANLKQLNWCLLLCLQFSGICKSSSLFVPQATKHSHCLPTSDKWKKELATCWEHWIQPKESRDYCVTVQKIWNKGKTTVSHVLWRHDTSNALQHREYFKILMVFQGIFFFFMKCRSGWPLCIV